MAICDWGITIDSTDLPDLYAPQTVQEFYPTPGGIDNLALSSTDIFQIPGQGTFTVNFNGYFRVARENTGAKEWSQFGPFVNMLDMRLRGDSPELGQITVRLNSEMVSTGKVFPGVDNDTAAKCDIATAVQFEIPKFGLTLFNKVPVLLMNDAIDSVPPVEDPNGEAHIYRLGLYDKKKPDGRPVGYLLSLRYTVGNYITLEEAEEYRKW